MKQTAYKSHARGPVRWLSGQRYRLSLSLKPWPHVVGSMNWLSHVHTQKQTNVIGKGMLGKSVSIFPLEISMTPMQEARFWKAIDNGSTRSIFFPINGQGAPEQWEVKLNFSRCKLNLQWAAHSHWAGESEAPGQRSAASTAEWRCLLFLSLLYMMLCQQASFPRPLLSLNHIASGVQRACFWWSSLPQRGETRFPPAGGGTGGGPPWVRPELPSEPPHPCPFSWWCLPLAVRESTMTTANNDNKSKKTKPKRNKNPKGHSWEGGA